MKSAAIALDNLHREALCTVAELRDAGCTQARARHIVRNRQHHQLISGLLCVLRHPPEWLASDSVQVLRDLAKAFFRASPASRSQFIEYILRSETPTPSKVGALVQAA